MRRPQRPRAAADSLEIVGAVFRSRTNAKSSRIDKHSPYRRRFDYTNLPAQHNSVERRRAYGAPKLSRDRGLAAKRRKDARNPAPRQVVNRRPAGLRCPLARLTQSRCEPLVKSCRNLLMSLISAFSVIARNGSPQ